MGVIINNSNENNQPSYMRTKWGVVVVVTTHDLIGVRCMGGVFFGSVVVWDCVNVLSMCVVPKHVVETYFKYETQD